MTCVEFDILFLPYYNSIFRYSLRLLKSIEDAEDLTQSVFLQAYRKKDKFKGHTVLAWLRTLTFNYFKKNYYYHIGYRWQKDWTRYYGKLLDENFGDRGLRDVYNNQPFGDNCPNQKIGIRQPVKGLGVWANLSYGCILERLRFFSTEDEYVFLKDLPENYRILILLSGFGFSLDEMSNILKIKKNTIKSRLQRARKRLPVKCA